MTSTPTERDNVSTATTIDLKLFCATEDSRYALSRPWSHGGYHYATNGYICARRKCAEVLPSSGRETPPAAELFRKPLDCYDRPVPLVSLPEPLPQVECGNCRGRGYYSRKTDTCLTCNGTGSEDADPRPVYWRDFGGCLSETYVRLLLSIGAAIYLNKDPKKPARFVAGDVEGIVAAMAFDPLTYILVGADGIAIPR